MKLCLIFSGGSSITKLPAHPRHQWTKKEEKEKGKKRFWNPEKKICLLLKVGQKFKINSPGLVIHTCWEKRSRRRNFKQEGKEA